VKSRGKTGKVDGHGTVRATNGIHVDVQRSVRWVEEEGSDGKGRNMPQTSEEKQRRKDRRIKKVREGGWDPRRVIAEA